MPSPSASAIIETGSKQYWVEPQSVIEVELVKKSDEKEITLDKVLFVRTGDKVLFGKPWLSNARVICDDLGDFRGRKVISFKFRRRKASRRIHGHRQELTRLRVKEIQVG